MTKRLPSPPAFAYSGPENYNMANHDVVETAEGGFCYKLKPEVANQQYNQTQKDDIMAVRKKVQQEEVQEEVPATRRRAAKAAPAPEPEAPAKASKTAKTAKAEKPAKEESIPSFSKAALELARNGDMTAEEISAEIAGNYPDLKNTGPDAVQYHIKRHNKNNPDDIIEEMIRVPAKNKAGSKLIPISEATEDQLPVKAKRGRPAAAKDDEDVEEAPAKSTKSAKTAKKAPVEEDVEEKPVGRRRVRA